MNNNFKDDKKVEKVDYIEVIDNIGASESKSIKQKIKKRNYITFYLIVFFIIVFLCILSYTKGMRELNINDYIRKSSPCSQIVENEKKKDSDKSISYSNSSQNLSPDKIFEKNSNSIVKICISSSFMNGGGIGSGIVLNKNGYILTNAHVVNCIEMNPKISVIFDDNGTNNSFDAKLVGIDVITDLAVIKIKKDGLIPAKFGDSNNIKPGQSVYTMGFPLGLSDKPSITGGIISGKDICINKDVWSTKFIQTDAAINSGNSGGALLNNSGEVIGINAIKIAEQSVEGMGFAIPSNDASQIATQIINKGYVARPALGITVSETYYGVIIIDFHEKSSLKSFANKRDRIVEINHRKIESISDLQEEIKKFKIGDIVPIKIQSEYTKKIIERNIVLFDIHS